MPGGRTILAASGSTIVPVDAVTRHGRHSARPGPGAHHLRHGPRAPRSTTLYAWWPGGCPGETANATAGVEIPTGLSVSSVYSPHGIAVTADGATVYVVGQGGDRLRRPGPPHRHRHRRHPATPEFDHYGMPIRRRWPSPPRDRVAGGRLGQQLGESHCPGHLLQPIRAGATPGTAVRGAQSLGTQHPTDIVLGPVRGRRLRRGRVRRRDPLPARVARHSDGPIPVCPGASSMAVAPAP